MSTRQQSNRRLSSPSQLQTHGRARKQFFSPLTKRKSRSLKFETLDERRVLATTQFSNLANIAVNASGAATPYPAAINVSALQGNVTFLAVDVLGVNHTFPDDIDMLLASPVAGRNAVLMSDAGGSIPVVNANLTFNDSASAPIPDTAAITSNVYQIANYVGNDVTDVYPAPAPAPSAFNSLASGFYGINPNGTWNLFINDDNASDSGSITSGYRLNFRTSVPVIDAGDFGGNGIANGTADSYRLVLNGTNLETYLNGTLSRTQPIAEVTNIVINGSSDQDTLNLDFSGGNFLAAAGFSFTSIENLVVTGTGANDTAFATATGGGALNFGITGIFSGSAAAGLSTFAFNTLGGNDTLTVDYTAGNIPFPINYDGGTQTAPPGDSLIIQGGNFASSVYTPSSPTNGTVTHVGGTTGTAGLITFTNLSPVTDTSVAATFLINATASVDTINVINAPTAGQVQVNSGATPTFELVNFANKAAVTIDATQGSADSVLVNFTVNATGLTSLTVNAGGLNDTLNVQASPAAVTTTLNGGGGLDNINVGNTGTVGAPGLLTPVAGPVVVNGQAGGANLVVDGSGAAIAADYALTSTTVTRTTPAGFGGVTYSNLTTLLLTVGSGANAIDVQSTAANVATTVNTNDGIDTITVNASLLGAGGTNTFNGGNNNDTINLNLTTANAFSAPVLVQGGAQDPAGGRDVVHVNDNASLGTVVANLTYTGNVGGSEVTLIGALLNQQLTVNTAETIDYNGSAANNDQITVVGTVANSDIITVAPIDPSRALVFNGGNPFDGPPENNATSFPGVSGGSTAPDLDLSGLAQANGLNIQDNGATTGDRLYVYGESQAALSDGTAFNAFGFGPGQLMPAVAVPASYDTITVTDTAVQVDGFVRVNYDNADFVQANPTLNSSVVVNAGFESTNSVGTADNITVTPSAAYKFQINGGDPDPATTGIVPPNGDRLTFGGALSVVNVWATKDAVAQPVITLDFPGSGNLPVSFSSIEDFGALTATTVNLIGDNNNPLVDQNDTFRVVGTDVDGNSADGGYQEFQLFINHAVVPLLFNGVQYLNVYGFDRQTPAGDVPATPATTDDIDTLDLRPYADNAGNPPNNGPRGWGVNVFFNEGSPSGTDGAEDLLIYHTSQGINVPPNQFGGGSVSENIVVAPSGPDNGEVRVTNAVDGSSIVTVQYVANTDIIVRDDDGSVTDTDILTLLGTVSVTGQASGNDTFAINADAAQDVANPLVTVTDTNSGTILYRLREYTTGAALQFLDSLTIDGLAGNDTINLTGGATNQQNDQFNFLGGEGDDSLNINMPNAFMFDGTGLFFDGGSGADRLTVQNTAALNNAVTSTTYTVGAAVGAGKLTYVDGFSQDMVVDFVNLEPVVDLVVSANLIVNATNANNAINYAAGVVATNGLVSVDDQETIEFSNKVQLTINALAGSDTVNLNNPTTPTALTTIVVNGGDPTDSDTLIINGRAGLQDQIRLLPTVQGAGTITQTGVPARNYTGIEVIRAVMDPVSSDHFTVDGTTGNDVFRITSGPATGEQIITGEFNAAAGTPFTLPTIYATGQSNALIGTLNFNGAGGNDTLNLTGTSSNDVFNFNRATATSGNIDHDINGIQTNFLGFANFTTINVDGLDGDDTFNVPGNFPTTLNVKGNNPSSGSDVLNFTGAGALITLSTTNDTLQETGFALVSYNGIEGIAINGTAGGLTVDGTVADDRFDVQPTAAGTGSLKVVTTGSIVKNTPQITYATVNNAAFTLNGGTGFDEVHLLGTNGVDTVTSTGATLTQAGGTVTFGTALERANIDAFDGDDSINITTFAAVPTIIRGGLGDDTILGSALADLIYGGSGNDVLIGAAGSDTIYGEDGNDRFGEPAAGDPAANDPGNDTFFGGDGSDLFVWDPGDGSDTIEGGAGVADVLAFHGNAGAENFNLFADPVAPTRMQLFRNVGAIRMDTADLEEVDIVANGGVDAINIGTSDTGTLTDLSTTALRNVDAITNGDAAADVLSVEGRALDDNLLVSVSTGNIRVAGLPYEVRLQADAALDRLVVNGNEGNDKINVNPTVGAAVLVTLNGGDDNDTLQGSNGPDTINGGNGNDYITGGDGADTIDGGNGEDTIVIGLVGPSDTITGGADYDTMLLIGTSGNDVIAGNQTAAGTLVSSLNGVTHTDTIATIERMRIEANSGDDIIFVQHLEALGTDAALNNSVLFDVDGGAAYTADRLVVQDNGASNVMIYRKSLTEGAGSVTVGPAVAEPLYTVFSGIEYVDPLTTNPNNIFVFKADPFEWNGNFQNATHLGAGNTLNVDPVIDPGIPNIVLPPGFNNPPADEDYYRLEANVTGTLDVQVFFRQNVGLPGAGDIDINLLDAAGNVVANDLDVDDDARIRVAAVEGQIYYLRVFQGVAGALNTYSVTVINEAAPVPFDLELDDDPVNGTTNPPGQADNSDTGRSQNDNITYDNTPTIIFRVPDNELINDVPDNSPGQPGLPVDGDIITVPFNADTGNVALNAGFRVAVYRTENNVRVHVGYATSLGNGLYSFTFPAAIPDGSNFISARVEMTDPSLPHNQGMGAFAQDLEIFVDTVVPPVFFGQQSIAGDGLHPNSDSGVLGPDPANIATLSDRITNDTTPTFWGRAEADAIIRAYVDVNNNGAVDLGTDLFIGFTVAIPYDGTNQLGNPAGNEPNGYWELTSVVNLDSQAVLTALGIPAGQSGGVRRILISAEDVAGNITSGNLQVQLLNLFIDEQGPQITGVEITGNPGFDIFDPKASNIGQSPTPLVNSLSVGVQDFPVRLIPGIPGLTDYPALQETIAEIAAHYQVKGDFNGIIPIQSVTFIPNAPINGAAATGTLVIAFFKPLPDDRFTLTIQDDVVDPAGNRLDGESNASEPQENPIFPSGDGVPGGDFVARFTVDSRPELGTWAAGSVWVDTNGNSIFDQDNLDFTNRDIAYLLGYTSDELFAGNFANAGVADGFDKLAAYGKVGATWRWQIDTDHDGVPNINIVDPAGINGFPVSGDFAPGLPGDEVGLFTGSRWFLDNNGDFNLQNGVTQLGWSFNGQQVIGYGFTGDFDGDGVTDLASWSDDVFYLDLSTLSGGAPNGIIDRAFRFGFPGARERPVAADMDRDGFDDIGLWTPDRTTQTPGDAAEWYILVSGGASLTNRIVVDPIPAPGAKTPNIIPFTPVPFGNDLYFQYGDEFSLPILGNFDPPVTPLLPVTQTNTRDSLDVNNDGKITAFDAIAVINQLNLAAGPLHAPAGGFVRAPFIDVDANGSVTAFDVIPVINYLNLHPTGAGEAVESGVFSAGEDTSGLDETLLYLLASDQELLGRSRNNK